MTNNVILILGGTKEAAALAEKLVTENPDSRIITSLAGRTKEPRPLSSEVRVGGFGGAAGLADYLIANGVTRLIDATHPFAKTISANAKIAADKANVRFEIITRPPWQKTADDHWIEVASLEKARDAIPIGARVLLALGSQHIALFASRHDVHFVIRMVDEPKKALPFASHTLIIGKPGPVNGETTLLKRHAITHIVCRNSGGKGAYAKIEAARALKVPVIMVSR